MRVLVAGDYVPIGRVAELINNNDYCCFKSTKPVVNSADYAIVNLECPVVIRSTQQIKKIGPALKCNDQAISAIKWNGFSCVTLANNHFRDYGDIGVEDTILTLEKNNLDYVGGGRDKNEVEKILYKSIGEETLAIINCCEHEFSIAPELDKGSNPVDSIKQYYAIKEANKNADYTLLIVHGGHENYQLPSPRMQELYRFFIDAGADAVVNHHQHCFSGYEIYHEKPIFYGVGNYCFDKLFNNTKNTWYEGYMVMLNFSAKAIDYSIYPYKQCESNPIIELFDDPIIVDRINALNKIISSPSELIDSFQKMAIKGGFSLSINCLSPYGNKYLSGLARRRLLPSFISSKRLIKALNIIRCESHRDLIIEYIQSILR